MANLDTSAVDEKLKPILAYVGKLTRTPSLMTDAYVAPVYAAGWDEQALFDAISVCALFNFLNRIVEGCGIKANPLEPDQAELDARMRAWAAQLKALIAANAVTRVWRLFGALAKRINPFL